MSEKYISFKERLLACPYVGKSVEAGDFFWGDGVTLHSTFAMKRHLGFVGAAGAGKNRKRRCFYVLQVISEKLVLACTTTTRNSHVWNSMPVYHHKYFLPVGNTSSAPNRSAITVTNDWEGVFEHGKSLLFLEDIEVIQTKYLLSYICSATTPEIQRIRWEARAFAAGIWWGMYLSPVIRPGSKMWPLGRLVWMEDDDFVRMRLDSEGLIILPEANTAWMRHSSNISVEEYSYSEKLDTADTSREPATKKCELSSPNAIYTAAPWESIVGPPKFITWQHPRQITSLTPRTSLDAGPSTTPYYPSFDTGYESIASLISWRSPTLPISKGAPRRIDMPWRRCDQNSDASTSSSSE
ncbi:hypothetical protein RUND412_000948 [Rhizina undulata]